MDLSHYLTPGKWTLFDFYSDYCPPCLALRPQFEQLHASHSDVNLVAVDINRPGVRGIDWGSPVARQYNLHSIPHLVVFGQTGKQAAEDSDDGDAARAFIYNRWMGAH